MKLPSNSILWIGKKLLTAINFSLVIYLGNKIKKKTFLPNENIKIFYDLNFESKREIYD